MPATPVEGDHYPTEIAPAIAENRGTVEALGALVTTTSVGGRTDTVPLEECTPLEEGPSDIKI